MSNEQKLREALQIGRDYAAEALAKHDQQYLRHPATEGERKLICADLTLLEQAFATTEPEPTGMPELPKPDEIGDRWLSSHVYTSDQMRTYGELCWKAGAADQSQGQHMTHNKRIEKLEAQVASLRRRLDSRTKQCIVLIDQIEQMKAALGEKDLEFTFTPIDLDDQPA